MSGKSRAYRTVLELSETLPDAYEKPGSALRPEDRNKLASSLPEMALLLKKRLKVRDVMALCDALLAVTDGA